MAEKHHRISLLIGDEQHQRLRDMGVNLSGLVRDLLNDHLTDSHIILHVGEKTKEVYQKIVSNTGATDADIEPYLMEALKQLLSDRIEEMQKLKSHLAVNDKKRS